MTDDLYEICWNSLKAKLLVDRDSFMVEARTWAASSIKVGEELAAVVLMRAGEIHIVKLGKHNFTRAHLRTVLRIGMITRVPTDDRESRAFVRRIGFNFIGADEYDHHYRLERLPHV